MQFQHKSEGLLPGEVRGWWPRPGSGSSSLQPLAPEAEFGVGRPQVPPQPVDSCYHPG